MHIRIHWYIIRNRQHKCIRNRRNAMRIRRPTVRIIRKNFIPTIMPTHSNDCLMRFWWEKNVRTWILMLFWHVIWRSYDGFLSVRMLRTTLWWRCTTVSDPKLTSSDTDSDGYFRQNGSTWKRLERFMPEHIRIIWFDFDLLVLIWM